MDAIASCHCLGCQRRGGSAFRANVPAPATSFRILTGIPREYIKTGDSSGQRRHAFCDRGGTPIYSCAADNLLSYTLGVGAVNQRRELGRPRRQIRVKGRLPWVPPLDGVPEAKGQS